MKNSCSECVHHYKDLGYLPEECCVCYIDEDGYHSEFVQIDREKCATCRKNSIEVCANGVPDCERGLPCSPTPTREEYDKMIDTTLNLISEIREMFNNTPNENPNNELPS